MLLGRRLRLEQFPTQPSGYTWRANRKKKKTKKNHKTPLLSYGLELREREVFWGGNFCLNWCRKEENFCCKSSCFSVIATDSYIATFSATTTVRNTQMTNRWILFYQVNTVFPWPSERRPFFHGLKNKIDSISYRGQLMMVKSQWWWQWQRHIWSLVAVTGRKLGVVERILNQPWFSGLACSLS